MRDTMSVSTGQTAVRLLYGLTIGLVALLALYAVGGLTIALGLLVAGWWPHELVVTTPIPGFTYPTATIYGRSLYLLQLTTRVTLLTALFVPLLGLLRSAVKRTQFTAVNVMRLRMMSVPFVVVALAQAVTQTTGSVELMILFDVVTPLIPWSPLLSALTLLAIAEVFAEGVRLRDDVDATI